MSPYFYGIWIGYNEPFNAYMNYFNNNTIYAILQALSPLSQELKEEILHKICLSIIDEYYESQQWLLE